MAHYQGIPQQARPQVQSFDQPYYSDTPQRGPYVRQQRQRNLSDHSVRTSTVEQRPLLPVTPSLLGTPSSSRSPSSRQDTREFAGANRTRGSFTLEPILEVPEGYPNLDWLPYCLKPFFLWMNAVVCLGIGGAICALIYGVGNDRQALLTSENAHILSTYAPTLIATINVLAFRTVFFEAFRMLPYSRMADQKGQTNAGASPGKSIGGSYFPWAFESYSDDFWLKIISRLLLFAVGVLTTFKSVFLGSQQTAGGWILTVHQRPGFYLIGAYGAMAAYYIGVFFWTKSRATGLKWDPAAPLDHLQLVWHTDAMSQIAQLPMNYDKAYKVMRGDMRFRLGYWSRVENDSQGRPITSTVHGIGILSGRTNWRCANDGSCTCDGTDRCTFDRCLYPPMSNRAILSLCIIVLAVGICLCVTIVVKGIFRSGLEVSGSWLMLNPVNATTSAVPGGAPSGYIMVAGQLIPAGDSVTANILFRAVPTFVAGIYATTIIEALDKRLRDTQCFSALAAGPCSSSESLALDYPSQMSFMVPVLAFSKSHYRLALVSFVATFAPLFPVFVAGLIIFERRSTDALHLVVAKPAFIIVWSYLVVFSLAITAAWPRKTELLLRPMYSFADFVKPFAHSWLLEEDTKLDAAMSEKTQEKSRARVLLAQYRYQLGITKGTCGRSHRGVDMIGNENDDSFRTIISAQALVKEQEAHALGNGQNWIVRHLESGAFGSGLVNLTRRATVRAA